MLNSANPGAGRGLRTYRREGRHPPRAAGTDSASLFRRPIVRDRHTPNGSLAGDSAGLGGADLSLTTAISGGTADERGARPYHPRWREVRDQNQRTIID
jgi:hypothetical protein